jgi:hypothetical protein
MQDGGELIGGLWSIRSRPRVRRGTRVDDGTAMSFAAVEVDLV